MTSAQVLKLHADDNVGIALSDLQLGEGGAVEAIPRGHKIALRLILKGEFIRKYGQIIGIATVEVPSGAHVHTQNLGVGDYQSINSDQFVVSSIKFAGKKDTFLGFPRADGRAGTRNYIGILSTVNCSGSVAQFIANDAERNNLLNEFSNVDGIVPIAHSSGCGMADRGEGYDILLRTLVGYAQHPNFGAILVVGLGCEVMQLSAIQSMHQLKNPAYFRFLSIQNQGGTHATIDAARPVLYELAKNANGIQRVPQCASKLVIGLQCGGSDGLSGITANPALGVASDIVVAQGGTSILSETPEIYGAEHLLTSRTNADVSTRLIQRIHWWESYTKRLGAEMNNNPSPGNKRGGLTTILEKSLGAVAKGGNAPLAAVYNYAEPIYAKGLVFMDSPGYDPCSVTGQIASGANLIVFTTGRGSVSGYRPVPCIKIASNNELWTRMGDDMDVNCGDIVNGVSLQEKGTEIYKYILKIASGTETKSEAQGFGSVEFVPWQIGAIM